MSQATLNRAIIAEARIVAENPKLRLKDLMEWSTTKIEPQEGETYYYLPKMQIHVAVKTE